jgi:putative tricarboxylic transport membrane protein
MWGDMDLVTGIINVFTPSNLLYCFLGCTLGTLIGVLPGLGPASTLSILLPITLHLNPTGSVIMLAGLYYGAQYGGSTTSILVNIPGEISSVVTCFDGFAMTQQGRGGQALWMAAVGSFIAGTLGCFGMTLIGPEIAKHALKFGPPESFGLLVFSMTIIVSLSGASLTRGLVAGLAGMILACVGFDPLTATPRFSWGSVRLLRGFDLIPVAIGLFGIGEILAGAEGGRNKIYDGKIGHMIPRGRELNKGLLASLRGTIIGFFGGLLPGLGPAMLGFLSYDVEKRISRHPEHFGRGAIEGLASPEACNNAAVQAGYIPLFTLGIPTSPANALILAALVLYGLQPGPLLFQENKEFVWTVIGSMYIGNVMLLILNLPLVGLWARISLIPFKYLGPLILAVCVVGAYSSRNVLFDVWVALAFGVVGFIMRKKGWPVAPLILGFLLGPMLERAFRPSLAMGGPLIFFSRPIPVVFFILAIVVTVVSLRYLRRVSKGSVEHESER